MSNEYLEELLEQCIKDRAEVFGGFHRPFLADCARRMAEWERRWEADPAGSADVIDLPHVAGSLLRSVMDTCCETGVRTLISAFRAREHDPECAAMGYEEFHAWVSGNDGRQKLLGRFPELERLLRLVAERRVEHAENVLRAVRQDRHLLQEAFGTGGRVVSFVPGLGDSHRGGMTVSLLRWDNGVTVIHKPQKESAQPILEAVRSRTDEDGTFFGPVHPRTVARPAHLWQEFIQHTDVDEAGGPAGYFRRFGRVAALLTMTGATDLHYENVIATARGPVVIDTETLVSLPGQHAAGGAGALAREIESSVLNTVLFPGRFSGAALDVDLSAVGCIRPADSRQLQSYRVVDMGTDRIRFDQVPVVVGHGSNMATVQGERVDPRLWAGEITAGFHEARERLRTHRQAIEEVVGQYRDWSVRQVLRPTYVYARFLEASTHPAYLRSTADRTELLGRLPRRHRGVDGKEVGDALHRDEVAALADLDVPFFDVPCDSRDLRGNDGQRVTTVSGRPADVGSTPREAALRSIADFFERPAGRDLTYIGYSLGSSVDDVWEARREPGHDGRSPALAEVHGWHATLADLVVSEDDQPTWLMPKLDGDGLRLGSVNAPLFEGGGLLLHLAEAGRAHGTSVIGADPGDVYAAAMPREVPPANDALSFSPFTGALSAVVTGLELARRGMDAGRIPLRAVPDGRGIDARSLSLADFDHLNGFGGYLLYRAEYAGEDGFTPAGPDAGQLLDRLVELDGSPSEHTGELGLAHGRFGRIAAMSALAGQEADVSGRVREHLDAFASSYLRHRWQDDALRDAASRTGWCKGYAGVAFGAAKLLRAVGYSAERTRDLIAPEVERITGGDPGPDLSFCHGAAGRVAMLCWLADRLSWPELRSEAASLSDRFLDRYGDGGWSFGIGSVSDLPSFLYGRSGWYYAQQMLADARVELPLCLGGR
ncbi:type 2 lanthipeptide synthetase LanM [Streptomyces sp. KLMMK]|uniref:type 2 lanthipeptide synthetase LanM n=1 Tax=Streptomyces sp. KLMMK TaxID=3109353 RepID=UPI00300939BA